MAQSVSAGSTARRGALAKIVASLLLALGIAGLTFAVATQLDEAWSGNFQAGSLLAEADCQPVDQPVVGKLGKPTFTETTTAGQQPWVITQVEFSNISDQCAGLNYEIAYSTGSEWVLLESATAQGTVAGPQVIADLGGLDSTVPTEFAIVFFR